MTGWSKSEPSYNFMINKFLESADETTDWNKSEDNVEGGIVYENCSFRGSTRPSLRSVKLPVKAMAEDGQDIPEWYKSSEAAPEVSGQL